MVVTRIGQEGGPATLAVGGLSSLLATPSVGCPRPQATGWPPSSAERLRGFLTGPTQLRWRWRPFDQLIACGIAKSASLRRYDSKASLHSAAPAMLGS
jgi:hypothetical protein